LLDVISIWAQPLINKESYMDDRDLIALWGAHCRFEFETRDVDATMATMVAEPYVNHIPTMTGGVGHDPLKRFYKYHFVVSCRVTSVATKPSPSRSRTVGHFAVVWQTRNGADSSNPVRSASQSTTFAFSPENSKTARTFAHILLARAPERLRFGLQQPDSAQFSLSRTATVHLGSTADQQGELYGRSRPHRTLGSALPL
jgi:hypothetical protein